MDLPRLSVDETALLHEMRSHLAAQIDAAGGRLPFDRYMDVALYAPGLGYYVNGRQKFGERGDFTTAPESSPVFSQCLASQVAECMASLGGGSVLEVGAGSGRMAADMLAELERLGSLPDTYLILELSANLRSLQQQTLGAELPGLLPRVQWLSQLPTSGFTGVVVGNELLDAMPVHRFRRHRGHWQELAVAWSGDGPADIWQEPFSPGLDAVLDRLGVYAAAWPDDYSSEINMRLQPWLEAVAASLQRGYVLLIDYGYSAREYYHHERSQGTLICHFRHRAHADPYLLPGLQDMTANVDFTAVAQAGQSAGFDLAGYTTQAHFLIDNGLERRVAASDPADPGRHLALVQGIKRLILPSEMGERFKVMALALDMPATLTGFVSRDLRDRL